MIQRLIQSWRQVLVQGYHAIRQLGRQYRPHWQSTMEDEPCWLSSRVVTGGPVGAVEETDAAVIIMTTFPSLATTEVTMELAGDRLLIQGTSPWVPSEADTCVHHMNGSHEVLIRSARLPCAVDLSRARVAREKNSVQIILPKRARGHIRWTSEKEQE